MSPTSHAANEVCGWMIANLLLIIVSEKRKLNILFVWTFTSAEQAAIGRVVGLLEVLAMVSLGLPEAMTTGKILLQTSPDKREFAREMNIFKSGLDFVSHFSNTWQCSNLMSFLALQNRSIATRPMSWPSNQIKSGDWQRMRNDWWAASSWMWKRSVVSKPSPWSLALVLPWEAWVMNWQSSWYHQPDENLFKKKK